MPAERHRSNPRAPWRHPGFLRDMLLPLAAALMTGVSGGLLLILLVFGLGSAQAAEPPPGGGRLTLYSLDGQPLQQAPLLKTEVEIGVTGMLARVRVVQRFHNPGDAWLEGVYQFPLPPGSAVERLRLRVGERVIEGEIREKRQAERVYQEARAAGTPNCALIACMFVVSVTRGAKPERRRCSTHAPQHPQPGSFHTRMSVWFWARDGLASTAVPTAISERTVRRVKVM